MHIGLSAISSTHEKVDGVCVWEHSLVSRVLKGAGHSTPVLRCLNTATWKVSTVLHYIVKMGSDKEMTLTSLTTKTCMLMSLTRPSRSVDLSNLDVGQKSYTPERLHFAPNTLAKQSKKSKPLQGFFSLLIREITSYAQWKHWENMKVELYPYMGMQHHCFWPRSGHTSQWHLAQLLVGSKRC